ncbi:hypothetical protein H5410_006944 [Solanum commersonii]|uniref:Retrotransposon gag domain-containing protein n=1 Tax=Solanum commersonii TaxID=4109 RepID=A0A9J6AAJ2_SOLCO|nr:hypothetical protein H5410_006944 [Solanum commersonii]
MDSTINTIASSKMIPTSSVAANSSASIAIESPMEVAQYQAASQNPPPNTRQKGAYATFVSNFNNSKRLTHSFNSGYSSCVHICSSKSSNDVNHYVEIENDAKSIDAEMMSRKMKSLEYAIRGLRGFDSSQSVRYEKLCTFPEIPKFEKFSGSGNPFFHLKIYCEKLIGVGKNEGLRIKLFNQSLTGKALEWYLKQDVTKWRTWDDHYMFHVEIAPDKIFITKLKPKSTECFREYAIPQDSEYYERMVTMGGKTFAEVIKAGEMIEDDLKTG